MMFVHPREPQCNRKFCGCAFAKRYAFLLKGTDMKGDRFCVLCDESIPDWSIVEAQSLISKCHKVELHLSDLGSVFWVTRTGVLTDVIAQYLCIRVLTQND